MTVIFKEISFYTLINILTKSLSLISIPILVTTFGVPKYGIIEFMLLGINTLVIACSLGLESSILRYFCEIGDDVQKGKFLGSICTAQLLVCSAVFLLFFAFYDSLPLPRYLNFELSSITYVFLLICVPCAIFYANVETLMRTTFNKFGYSLISIYYLSSILTLNVLCFVWDINSITTYFQFYAANFIILFLICLYLVRNKLSMFSILEKKFLLYSIPILLVSLIGTVYPMLERGVILKHLDLVDLGTYALAFKVSSISLIVSTGITMGVVPQLLNGKANKIADRTVILDLSLYLLVISIAATFLASHIFVFLEKNVNTTAIYFSAFFISSGFAANGLAAVLGIGVLISGKTKYRLLINIFFTFFGLILLPHVVTYFGILGVACLFFLTRLLVLLVEAVVAHRLTGLEWQSSCLHITILPLAIILCLTSISSNISSMTALMMLCFWTYQLYKYVERRE